MMAAMIRHLSLLLIALFLVVQGISAVHAADYGMHEHEHHGQICDVYLHGEQAKSSDIPAASVLTVFEVASFTVTSIEASHVTQNRYSVASPRAPPYFS